MSKCSKLLANISNTRINEAVDAEFSENLAKKLFDMGFVRGSIDNWDGEIQVILGYKGNESIQLELINNKFMSSIAGTSRDEERTKTAIEGLSACLNAAEFLRTQDLTKIDSKVFGLELRKLGK